MAGLNSLQSGREAGGGETEGDRSMFSDGVSCHEIRPLAEKWTSPRLHSQPGLFGKFSDRFVLGGRFDLPQNRLEMRLVRLAQETVVCQFDDYPAGRLARDRGRRDNRRPSRRLSSVRTEAARDRANFLLSLLSASFIAFFNIARVSASGRSLGRVTTRIYARNAWER